ncbi:unnamed protein product [Heligmosomoides polygyrus]|uniref:Apple domain-containing protein n=1 Tax=Heligmosomoides polygyrus TaxID=6339 RepID=A0A3P8CVP3_HELPZ|nr:unnamed protein product [Heligmosomoides polygyrus]
MHPNMVLRNVLKAIFSPSSLNDALLDHFGDPCYLCRCFVEYTDRDVAVPIRPYAMAADGYDTTEDRCLATCLRDKKCGVAVYGMVGGRKVFACEFYEHIDSRRSPFYSPFVNIYIKKTSCPLKG